MIVTTGENRPGHRIIEEEEEESVKKLESMNMMDVDLSDVDSQLMASAIVRVKSVDMSGTYLTADQVNTLCCRIIEEEESVKTLECLNMMDVDLSDVGSQLLASAFVRVKSVDITDTDLTTDQVDTICKMIIEKNCLILEDLTMNSYVQDKVRDMVKEKVKLRYLFFGA